MKTVSAESKAARTSACHSFLLEIHPLKLRAVLEVAYCAVRQVYFPAVIDNEVVAFDPGDLEAHRMSTLFDLPTPSLDIALIG